MDEEVIDGKSEVKTTPVDLKTLAESAAVSDAEEQAAPMQASGI